MKLTTKTYRVDYYSGVSGWEYRNLYSNWLYRKTGPARIHNCGSKAWINTNNPHDYRAYYAHEHPEEE